MPMNLNEYMDKFNDEFYAKYGYCFCRCYDCVLPILVKNYFEIKKSGLPTEELKKVVEDINSDYLLSADYRMDSRPKSGLVCGYDCSHYEEKEEACPFIFWEIDKTKWDYIMSLLNSQDFISFFEIA